MTIQLELAKNGKRISLTTSRPLAGMKNIVPGANFNKGSGTPYWSLPLSMPVCHRLRKQFGEELAIGPALTAWAKAETSKASAMKALAASHDAVLSRVPTVAPRLAKAMASRTYQRVGARFVAEAMKNGAGCLVADQPGLGKTLEAIGGVLEAEVAGPYLVVTPKTSVVTVWGREIPRWVDGQTIVTLPEGDRTVAKVKTTQRVRRDAVLNALASSPSLDATWVIVHPEAVRTQVWWVCGVCGEETRRKAGKVELKCIHDPELRKRDRIDHEYPQLFGREWGAIIVDESDRSLLRLSGTPTQTRQGMEMIPLRDGGLRVAMTGTPTRGRPHLLWGTLNWLDAKAHPSFWNWAELFWEVTSNGYSMHVLGDLLHEDELWKSLDRYVLRRTKAEVAPDMPAKTYVGTPAIVTDEDSPHGVWLPMEGVQAKAYKDMLETSAADLEDGSRVEAIGFLAELTRLKQFAGASGKMIPKVINEVCKNTDCPEGTDFHKHKRTVQQFVPTLPSNKFEYLVQLLDELGFPDSPTTKVVVVSQFTSMLELFAAELPARLQALSAHPRTPIATGMMPVLLTGEQSGASRERAISAMNDEVGHGAHLLLLQTKTGGVAITLDYADVMVFLDETWIPDDQEQAEDRIHRVSRPRPVFYHYLRSLGTVDLGIALTNAERDRGNKRLLDERRGVEYARAVLKRTRELDNGMDHRPCGNCSRSGDGLCDGCSDRTGSSRAVEHRPGGNTGQSSSPRRDRPEKASDITLAPKQASPVQSNQTKGIPPNPRSKKSMAKQLTDEEIKAYNGKASTAVQTRYADWLIEKLEIEFTGSKKEAEAKEALFRETVRVSTALRMIFQASPENQEAREEGKAEREEAQEAKAAEKAKAKADKKAAKAAKPAEDDEAEADETPAPKAKPAKKSAKAAKPAAPADDEDAADTAVAAAPKPKAPKKASARSGAAAPF